MKKLLALLVCLPATVLTALPPAGAKVVTYEDFGAIGDGKTNDWKALFAAHQYANKHLLPVRARDDAHYYIGEMDKTITIQTSTDFGKAHFTIDDRNLTKNSNRPIFSVSPIRGMGAKGITKQIPSIKKGQKKVDVQTKYPSMVTVRTNKQRHFIRYGVNANSGSEIRDSFLISPQGDIDPTTPVLWDMPQVSSAALIPIPPDQLVIRGGTFLTLANAEKGPHVYYARNFYIYRSNTKVEGLTHLIKEPDSTHSFPYAGFLSISGCANILIKDCVLTGHKQYYCVKPNSASTSTGTYDLSLNMAINVTLLNCSQSNDIYDRTWGIMGSNKCKNLTYDNCRLSRFDAHQGVCNAVIRNSEVGRSGIHVTGFGTLLVENCTFRRSALVNLRQDYGSFWDGDIIIRNSVWHIGSAIEPTVLTGHNPGTHDFGYECRMPRSITLENLVVKDKKHHRKYKGIALLGNFNRNFGKKQIPQEYQIKEPEKIIIKNLKTESGKKLYISPQKQMYKKVKVKVVKNNGK